MNSQKWIPPGTVVAAWIWFVWHEGIVTEHQTVISASFKKCRVVEESFEEFSEGNEIRIVGRLGRLTPHEVVRRARLQLNTPWTVQNNCEHVARRACGVAVESPQLKGYLAIATALLLVVASRKAA